MNVIRVELVREIGNMNEYKVTYEESEEFTVKVVGRTFNYDYEIWKWKAENTRSNTNGMRSAQVKVIQMNSSLKKNF